MGKVIEQIRTAIGTGKKSRYAIAKETGIPQSQLSRLMSGEKGLSIESLERVADCLGLEVVIRPKAKAPKRGRKGR